MFINLISKSSIHVWKSAFKGTCCSTLPVFGVLSASAWWHLQPRPSSPCRVSQDVSFFPFVFELGELRSVGTLFPVWTGRRTAHVCIGSDWGWQILQLRKARWCVLMGIASCLGDFSVTRWSFSSISIGQITCLSSASLVWKFYCCSQEEYNRSVYVFRSCGNLYLGWNGHLGMLHFSPMLCTSSTPIKTKCCWVVEELYSFVLYRLLLLSKKKWLCSFSTRHLKNVNSSDYDFNAVESLKQEFSEWQTHFFIFACK